MIAFRKRHPCLRRTRFLTGNQSEDSRMPDVIWHGLELTEPGWSDPDAQALAFTLAAAEDREEDLHVILNMSDDPLSMPLYQIEGKTWHRAVDTSQASPQDILEPSRQKPVKQLGYRVNARSVVVLESR
jgi:isoamylase